MTTIHLTDAQRDTFAACGIIVIDGEPDGHRAPGRIFPPEGWRILTEPCEACWGAGERCVIDHLHVNGCPVSPCPDCVGGRRVVTLTATCLVCLPDPSVLRPCANCDNSGEEVLGDFTIPALLPVVDTTDVTDDEDPMAAWDDAGDWVEVDRDAKAVLWWHSDRKIDGAFCTYLPLDPPPRPGQFIARPERVA